MKIKLKAADKQKHPTTGSAKRRKRQFVILKKNQKQENIKS